MKGHGPVGFAISLLVTKLIASCRKISWIRKKAEKKSIALVFPADVRGYRRDMTVVRDSLVVSREMTVLNLSNGGSMLVRSLDCMEQCYPPLPFVLYPRLELPQSSIVVRRWN